jgi:steroid 5-alpha reductase family enzyme
MVCSIVKDNSWIDAFWGISFVLPIAAVWIARAVATNNDNLSEAINARMILSFVCVCIWAFRLAWHIARRHTKEDFRYVEFRNNWSKHGTFWLYVQFYLKIFCLQAFFSLIVNSAALFTAIFSGSNTLTPLDYVGVAIWLFGFVFEWVGDH